MPGPRAVLRLGDEVLVDGVAHTVAGLAGTSVRLVSASGAASVVVLSYLLASPGFEIVGGVPPPPLTALSLLDGLPEDVLRAAREWERRVMEVNTGLPPGAEEGATPRADYDPAVRRVRACRSTRAAQLNPLRCRFTRSRTSSHSGRPGPM